MPVPGRPGYALECSVPDSVRIVASLVSIPETFVTLTAIQAKSLYSDVSSGTAAWSCPIRPAFRSSASPETGAGGGMRQTIGGASISARGWRPLGSKIIFHFLTCAGDPSGLLTLRLNACRCVDLACAARSEMLLPVLVYREFFITSLING